MKPNNFLIVASQQLRENKAAGMTYLEVCLGKGCQQVLGMMKSFERIREIKESTSIEELSRRYPKEFAAYLNYCRSLRFDEKADYGHLMKLFRRLFDRKGYGHDLKYDWVLGHTRLLHSLRTVAGVEEGRFLQSLRTVAGGEEGVSFEDLRTLLRSYPSW